MFFTCKLNANYLAGKGEIPEGSLRVAGVGDTGRRPLCQVPQN